MKSGSFNVKVTVNTTPYDFCTIINEMADYLEGNEPPPNHWDEDNRNFFYKQMSRCLSIKAIKMIDKLQERLS